MVVISAMLWLQFVLSSVILTPLFVILFMLTRPFDSQLRILHFFSCFWGAQYIWINPFWSLKIKNRSNFNDKQAHIIVCNHQSLVDIIVIYSLFRHFKWTSKSENFSLPFVGWVLSLNNSIRIYRGVPGAYEKFAENAHKALKNGSSVVIFPEGTRSKDGKLGRFREGAFLLVHEAKVPVLPMVIVGSASAVPKNSWIIQVKQKIILKVLDPVPYSSIEGSSAKETSCLVRNIISRELESALSEQSQ